MTGEHPEAPEPPVTDPRFQTFDQLLQRALTDPQAEAELRRRYAREVAVLVVDFTAMVHRTDQEGIVYALALARAAEARMKPAVAAHGGEVIKQVADTFFAVFPDVEPALMALLDARAALADFNRGRTGTLGDGSRNEPIFACGGLGFGDTLVIPGENLFGAEVNRAFVLGEDTAKSGEMLCTPDFARRLGMPPPGIGLHGAPADRVAEVGFPFLVLQDHRGAD
jgi:adenylate cyclase